MRVEEAQARVPHPARHPDPTFVRHDVSDPRRFRGPAPSVHRGSDVCPHKRRHPHLSQGVLREQHVRVADGPRPRTTTSPPRSHRAPRERVVTLLASHHHRVVFAPFGRVDAGGRDRRACRRRLRVIFLSLLLRHRRRHIVRVRPGPNARGGGRGRGNFARARVRDWVPVRVRVVLVLVLVVCARLRFSRRVLRRFLRRRSGHLRPVPSPTSSHDVRFAGGGSLPTFQVAKRMSSFGGEALGAGARMTTICARSRPPVGMAKFSGAGIGAPLSRDHANLARGNLERKAHLGASSGDIAADEDLHQEAGLRGSPTHRE